MGAPVYRFGTNTNRAAKLRGNCSSIYGTGDVNAPSCTMVRMIDALIRESCVTWRCCRGKPIFLKERVSNRQMKR